MDSDDCDVHPSEASLLAIELKVKGYPPPTYDRHADGIFLHPHDVQAATYLPLFDRLRRGIKDPNDYYVDCLLCLKTGKKDEIKVTQKKSKESEEREIKMQKVVAHIEEAHPEWLTREAWLAVKATEAAEAAAAAAKAAGAGGAAAAKRARAELSTSAKVEHTERFVELCVGAELSLDITHNMAWQEFCGLYGIPLCPETTARERMEVMFERDVVAANKAWVGNLIMPTKLTVGDESLPHIGKFVYTATPIVAGAVDGWSKHGAHFLTHALSGAQLRVIVGGHRELRPNGRVVSVSSFEPEKYTPEAQAGQINADRIKLGLEAADFFYAMDTTATNPATMDTDHMKDAIMVRDNEHVFSLAVHDLMSVAEFSNVITAAHELAVLMTSTTKYKKAMASAAADLGKKLLCHDLGSPTRFLNELMTSQREAELAPIYMQIMYKQAEKRYMHPDMFAAFQSAWMRFSPTLTYINAMNMMTKPLMDMMARFGSEEEYTMSVRNVIVDRMLAHIKPFKMQMGITATAIALEKSVIRRLGSVKRIELTASILPLTSLERRRRLQEDAMLNAAEMLDPAMFPYFTNLGGVEEDAAATYMEVLRKSCTVVSSPAAAAVAAANNSQLGIAIAKIQLLPKPSVMMADTEWAKEKEALIKMERDKYKDVREGLGGYNADKYAPLQEGLMKELEMLRSIRLRFKLAAAQDPPVFEFGDPVAAGNKARYKFWPEKKGTMPILYFLAKVILCPWNHTLACEREHKAMGRIFSRYRAGMKMSTVEKLTLGRQYYIDKVKKNSKLEHMAAAGSTLEELEAFIQSGMGAPMTE